MRFPEFKDEWQTKRLSQLLRFQNGINADSEKYGRGVKYISVLDILNNDSINYDCIKGLIDIDEETLDHFSVTDGDILFQRSSETIEDIGHSNVYLDTKKAAFGGFVIRGKKIGCYHPLFLKYLLDSPSYRKQISRLGAGAQHYNIGQTELCSVILRLPSTEEQKKIAQLNSFIDGRIATQKKIIEDLFYIEKFVVNKTCIGDRISSIHDCVTQVASRNKEKTVTNILSVSNKNGFVKQSEQFEDRELASEDTSKYKIIKRDGFVYNPARINVGSIARYEKDDSGIVSPMYVCFVCKNKILPGYLERYLKTQVFRHEMFKRLEGSVRQCLSFDGFANIPIFVPSIDAQILLIKKLSSISNSIDIERTILSGFETQKRFFLENMFV